jgi:hypothetical protein
LRSLHVLKESRNQIQLLPVCVRSKTIGIHRARVTCVDINAKEIIEQYLIEVDAGKPKVQDVKSINCSIGMETPYKFEWTNPIHSHKMTFTIASSNSDFIKPDKTSMEFNPGEKKWLGFFVSP